MKTVRKLAAVVLVGAMALSMAACKKSAKKVSVDEFKKACEEVGLTVENLGGGGGMKEAWGCENSDGSLEVTYCIVEDKADAKKQFEQYTSMEDQLKEAGADVKVSGTRMEATMDGKYMFAVLADDMFVNIMASDADSAETAKMIVEKLGI
ncbi:MAG: hypothetical protein IKX68_06160 [Clostridiales bacterium]|nr:hypothetical protein [Clostridiales bacterium]